MWFPCNAALRRSGDAMSKLPALRTAAQQPLRGTRAQRRHLTRRWNPIGTSMVFSHLAVRDMIRRRAG